MIIRPRSFPHPVLAPFKDDVVPNDFLLTAAVSFDPDMFYLDVSLEYKNETLSALTEQGKAVHAVHVECRHNYFRELHRLPEPRARLSIPSTQLRGRVELCGFILAKEVLPTYGISGAHADYGALTFEVRPGDVLAVGETLSFDAYVDYDPLTTLSSILKVVSSEDLPEGPMRLDTGDHQLIVTLSQEDYKRYTELKGDLSLGPLLANQVVIPAVIEAINEMKQTPEEDIEIEMTKRWYRSVHKKLRDMGVDLPKAPALEAAQAILQLPLRRSLEGILHATAEDAQP